MRCPAVASLRGAWISLVSTAAAYLGLLTGVGVLELMTTPKYAHVRPLRVGLVALPWSVLALVSVAVSTTSLVLTFRQLRRWVW